MPPYLYIARHNITAVIGRVANEMAQGAFAVSQQRVYAGAAVSEDFIIEADAGGQVALAVPGRRQAPSGPIWRARPLG